MTIRPDDETAGAQEADLARGYGAIDYLAKDYASFRRLMLERMSARIPDWSERNPADLGVTVVEALAFAGDILSYRQDALANEAYVNTASSRISVRRHLRILGHRLHEGCNARVWAIVDPCEGRSATIESGTRLLTSIAPVVARERPGALEDFAAAAPAERVHYETMHAFDVSPGGVEIAICDAARLPAGTQRVRLQVPASEIRPQQVLLFEQGEKTRKWHVSSARVHSLVDETTGDLSYEIRLKIPLPFKVPVDFAERSRRVVRATVEARAAGSGADHWEVLGLHPRTLDQRELRKGEERVFVRNRPPGTDLEVRIEVTTFDVHRGFTHAAAVTHVEAGGPDDCAVTLHPEDALPAEFIVGGGEEEPRTGSDAVNGVTLLTTRVLGNVILADQGSTVWEALGAVPEGSRFAPTLEQPVISAEPLDRSASASRQLSQNPADALPQIELIEVLPGGALRRRWSPRLDLVAVDRRARVFVVETAGDGTARLRFPAPGSGLRPTPGAQLVAKYRVDATHHAGIGSDALMHALAPVIDATTDGGGANAVADAPLRVRVRNPLPSSEPGLPEDIETAKLIAPARARLTHSLLGPEQLASVAREIPGVLDAFAQIRWNGRARGYALYILPRDHLDLDVGFEASIRERLKSRLLAGETVEVCPPRWEPLALHLKIGSTPGIDPAVLYARVFAALVGSEILLGPRNGLHRQRRPDAAGGGFFARSRRRFAELVQLADVIEVLTRLSGVATVECTRFRLARASSGSPELNHTLIAQPGGLLCLDPPLIEASRWARSDRTAMPLFSIDDLPSARVGTLSDSTGLTGG